MHFKTLPFSLTSNLQTNEEHMLTTHHLDYFTIAKCYAFSCENFMLEAHLMRMRYHLLVCEYSNLKSNQQIIKDMLTILKLANISRHNLTALFSFAFHSLIFKPNK